MNDVMATTPDGGSSHSISQALFLLLWFIAGLIFVPSLFFCIHLCRRCFSQPQEQASAATTLPGRWVELTNNVKEREECCICLSLFQGNEKFKVLIECQHVFHSHCLDMWLTAHPTCPLCRSSLHVPQNLIK
ncbi:hypothetical protein VNO78_27893 [Psophocarpus tetragonolobus]|uniref:RING-type domain-containing protein n=1 Tax=Psophocarpus tetragonolobus TaxID=3891 RepID=A0AAN9S242_PSOTE